MGFAMGSPGGKDEARMKMSGAIYAKCIRTFNFISCVGPADYMYLRDNWLSERNCCSSSDFRVSFIPLNGRECFYQRYRELVKSFQLPSPQVLFLCIGNTFPGPFVPPFLFYAEGINQ